MAILDPPYYKILKEKWDNQWKSESDYIEWCRVWTEETVRTLKPGGVLCVWGTTKTDTFLRYKLDVLNRCGLDYQSWIIWSYDWGGRSKKNFARKHEDLLVYSKGKDFTFNGDAVRIPYKIANNVNKNRTNNPLGKIPTSVWEKNVHTTSKEYVSWHPTQKPIYLLSRIVLAYSNKDDTVMDIFSGSGSTAIAAINNNRHFIGCEIDKEYYEDSLIRIKHLAPSSQYTLLTDFFEK